MRFFVRRLLQLIPVLLIVSFLTFLLLNLLPGGPETAALGIGADEETQQEFRMAMRKRVYEEQGLLLKAESGPVARNQVQHSLLCGSPDTVTEALAEIDKIGVGGLILVFRLGPMPYDVAASSIRLFMNKVAPNFR